MRLRIKKQIKHETVSFRRSSWAQKRYRQKACFFIKGSLRAALHPLSLFYLYETMRPTSEFNPSEFRTFPIWIKFGFWIRIQIAVRNFFYCVKVPRFLVQLHCRDNANSTSQALSSHVSLYNGELDNYNCITHRVWDAQVNKFWMTELLREVGKWLQESLYGAKDKG